MSAELFKFEDKGGGYRFVTCPEHPGFSAMLKPGEVWFADDHVRALLMLVSLDATAATRAEIERLRAALKPFVKARQSIEVGDLSGALSVITVGDLRRACAAFGDEQKLNQEK